MTFASSRPKAYPSCGSRGRFYFPAGGDAFNPVERETLPLEPGDTFVLFSDGVSEAMNTADEFYGEERLLSVLSANAGASRPSLVSRPSSGDPSTRCRMAVGRDPQTSRPLHARCWQP